jgi:6-phosphofructokinase 1
MRIAILCSGGDCAGMNPAVKQFVDYCLAEEIEPYFIYDGLEGMIDGTIKRAEYSDVAGIMHLGGTMIRSSRSPRFYEYAYRKEAYENLQKHGIDRVVILGGDGSFRAMHEFHQEFGVRFVGIPATIDNDIYGTEYCLGVDTSLNIIRNATDAIRDNASSIKRASVIETMGRECGYLALVSAIVSGAEVCIIPEAECDFNALALKLKSQLKQGRTYIICVVAEGTKMTQKTVEWLEHEIGMETRATVLGYVQRGGNPTVFDRLMAAKFVEYAVDYLEDETKEGGSVVVYQGSQCKLVPIDYVLSESYQLDEKLLDMAKDMMR